MKVSAFVHVRSKDGSKRAVLRPGDTVPEWATVTNKAVLVFDILPAPAPEPAVKEELTPETPSSTDATPAAETPVVEPEPAPAPKKPRVRKAAPPAGE